MGAKGPELAMLPCKHSIVPGQTSVTTLSGALPECPFCALDAAEARAKMLEFICDAQAAPWTEDDQPLPEDADIDAAFPTRSGRHDLYGEAMRLVGARRSKAGLVGLVTWLLHRAERKAR